MATEREREMLASTCLYSLYALLLLWLQFFNGRPFVKRFALCYRSVVCLSVLSVCLSVCL